MIHSEKNFAKRDGRLSLALLLFVIFAGSLLVQAWILLLYFRSAVEDNWTDFLEIFPSYAFPPPGPGRGCYDNCYPDLPFIAGWIGIAGFLLAMCILAYSWWRPKPRDSP
jgi:hypothetical protein